MGRHDTLWNAHVKAQHIAEHTVEDTTHRGTHAAKRHVAHTREGATERSRGGMHGLWCLARESNTGVRIPKHVQLCEPRLTEDKIGGPGS